MKRVKSTTNKDGTTSYIVRWVDAEGRGRRWRSRSFRDLHAAEDFALDLEKAKRRGTYAAPDPLTVGQLVAAYLERGSKRWSAGTVYTYKQRAEAHILPRLGAVPVERLSTPRVQGWIDALTRAGLAPGTIQPTLAVLTGALAEAVRLGILDRNPATGVKAPRIARAPVPVWSADEARSFLAVAASEPRWHAVYQVMLTCGLRPGELRALQWVDVDVARARLRVRRTVSHAADGGYEVHQGTKRGAGRTVALTLPTLAALRLLPKRGIWLFGASGPLSSSVWTRNHRRLCQEAGVPVITLHQLRHTCASLLLEQGAHPKVVSALLGHSSIEVTLDLYSHVATDLTEAAQAGLADWLSAGGGVRSDVRLAGELRDGTR